MAKIVQWAVSFFRQRSCLAVLPQSSPSYGSDKRSLLWVNSAWWLQGKIGNSANPFQVPSTRRRKHRWELPHFCVDHIQKLVISTKSTGNTVWKLRKFTVTLIWQKFREINVFTKENTKELIWRNFLWVKVSSSFSTLWEILSHLDFFVKSVI